MTFLALICWLVAGVFNNGLADVSLAPVTGWGVAFLAAIALDLIAARPK